MTREPIRIVESVQTLGPVLVVDHWCRGVWLGSTLGGRGRIRRYDANIRVYTVEPFNGGINP